MDNEPLTVGEAVLLVIAVMMIIFLMYLVMT